MLIPDLKIKVQEDKIYFDVELFALRPSDAPMKAQLVAYRVGSEKPIGLVKLTSGTDDKHWYSEVVSNPDSPSYNNLTMIVDSAELNYRLHLYFGTEVMEYQL